MLPQLKSPNGKEEAPKGLPLNRLAAAEGYWAASSVSGT